MTKIQMLLQILAGDEHRVADALRELVEQHTDEHDLVHVARVLASWSEEHGERLLELGRRYDVEAAERPDDAGDRLLADAADELQEHVGDAADAGFLLLRHLRAVHLACVGLSLDWEMLAQTAKAVRDDDMQAVAERCQHDAVRQMKWSNTKIKEAAPQVMAS